MRTPKLRLGLFVAPYHPLHEDPHLCYEDDLHLAEFADQIGMSEIWYGEHHSAGVENSSSPELMIAAAAQRTKRIRLGTGVISVPYHNPLMTANRIIQLDHLTDGRLIFGAGPGLLSSDAHMLGIDPRESRDKLDQGLNVILRLLRGEWVTEESSWYRLRDAHCHVLPHSEKIDVYVASTFSPSGGTLAGKYGTGMLCLASTVYRGFDALATNWKIAQEVSAQHGRTMNAASLRCATDIHIAETREQAFAEVREGYEIYRQYLLNMSGPLEDNPARLSLEELVERGDSVVGTPDDAIAQIRRLESKVPGFGGLLIFDRNLARLEDKKRSLKMMMRYVMPVINEVNANRVKSYDWVRENNREFLNQMLEGSQRAFEKHAAETKKN